MTSMLSRLGLASTLVALAAIGGCDASAETIHDSALAPSLAAAVPGGVGFDDALRTALRRYPYLRQVPSIAPILNGLAVGTCNDFAHGRTTGEVISTRFSGASIDVTEAAIEIAVDSFCPQYRGWSTRSR